MYEYERDTLLTGLTRPAMIKGVGLNWMFLNTISTLIGFALSASAFAVFIFPIGHVIGVLIYKKDVSAVSIMIKRLKVGWTPNSKYWGGNSYNG